MSKFETFSDYPQRSLISAEAALLTIWPSLNQYQDDLVLVGGLAVHYLTRRNVAGLPGAVTMDVDLGIALGTSGGQYGTIKSNLAGLGFRAEGNRLLRTYGNIGLYLDFLTEDPAAQTGARMVDDVIASVVPGIDRALTEPRYIKVRGEDFYGVAKECTVAIADIGPLLTLKLNAFGGPTGRRHPKDAYDILLAVTGFIDGPEAAIKAFHAEAHTGNTAYEAALKTLRADFSELDQDGPSRAALFHSGDSAEHQRLKQEVVTVGRYLLGV